MQECRDELMHRCRVAEVKMCRAGAKNFSYSGKEVKRTQKHRLIGGEGSREKKPS